MFSGGAAALAAGARHRSAARVARGRGTSLTSLSKIGDRGRACTVGRRRSTGRRPLGRRRSGRPRCLISWRQPPCRRGGCTNALLSAASFSLSLRLRRPGDRLRPRGSACSLWAHQPQAMPAGASASCGWERVGSGGSPPARATSRRARSQYHGTPARAGREAEALASPPSTPAGPQSPLAHGSRHSSGVQTARLKHLASVGLSVTGLPAAPVDNLCKRLARSTQVEGGSSEYPIEIAPIRTERFGYVKGLVVSVDPLLRKAEEARAQALVDGCEQHQKRCEAGVDVRYGADHQSSERSPWPLSGWRSDRGRHPCWRARR